MPQSPSPRRMCTTLKRLRIPSMPPSPFPEPFLRSPAEPCPHGPDGHSALRCMPAPLRKETTAARNPSSSDAATHRPQHSPRLAAPSAPLRVCTPYSQRPRPGTMLLLWPSSPNSTWEGQKGGRGQARANGSGVRGAFARECLEELAYPVVHVLAPLQDEVLGRLEEALRELFPAQRPAPCQVQAGDAGPRSEQLRNARSRGVTALERQLLKAGTDTAQAIGFQQEKSTSRSLADNFGQWQR
eukprot:CAMPEP_0177585352 /NCGR_PEP_ID=MMETSP0419_2-20121207/4443_1 /TAXON_ID=582737 /ORGANISM="Tetraselmis sp., Strain GSL018" /LENGTH=241 /DNA_ID=CAMNT_0019075071 /DNA_START=111 /DNA_END=838 /DNA_ORIENTATION=-